MIPKKIYLNYTSEDDPNKAWSEQPLHSADGNVKNREYTDIYQVWYHFSVVPTKLNQNIIYITIFDEVYIEFIPRCLGGKLTNRSWNDFAMHESMLGWAYLDDLLPKEK